MAIDNDSDDSLSDTTLHWGRPWKKKNEKCKKKAKKNFATRASRRKAMLWRHLLRAGMNSLLVTKNGVMRKKNIKNAP